jgi:SAM-dependent methyltransferase
VLAVTLDYDSLHTHRWMLRDGQRMQAFGRALRELVRPGMVVLDVGAGSGVLSLMAARAGAARVYAVERTPMARLARKLAACNGLAAVVKVAEADMQHVSLPERADLIVSEWLGTIGVDENLLYPVLLARDRWLEPGGLMMPSTVRARLAPAGLATRVEIDQLRATRAAAKPSGDEFDLDLSLDLSLLAEPSVHELLCRRYQVRPQDLAGEPQTLWTTETGAASLGAALEPSQAELSFDMAQARRINALVAWFEADLSPGVTLSNAPDRPETHWGQLTLPLQTALDLPAGSRLQVRVACLPRVPGVSDLAWAVRVDDGPWESHDTRVAQGHSLEHASLRRSHSPTGDTMMNTPDSPAAPAAQAAAEAVVLPTAEQAAPLTRFLARLSVDTDMLYRLIRDPQAVFEQEGLAEDDINALVSREASAIEQAMMKGAQP